MSTLKKKIVYDCTITLKTGLHIGGTNAALNIGGPDKFVVRNPLDNIPYIPGSSLKGNCARWSN
jgi:CRISPR-associated protein Csm3